MDWKRFEELCGVVLGGAGFVGVASDPVVTGGDFEMVAMSASGGKVTRHDVAVRCRRWTMPVGIEPVRAFLGAVRRRGMPHAMFITAGSFARRVRIEFAHEPELVLVDGRELVEGILDLGPGPAGELLEKFIDSDGAWRVPTCPACDLKMERIERGEDGPDSAGNGVGGDRRMVVADPYFACRNRLRRAAPCGERFSQQGFPLDGGMERIGGEPLRVDAGRRFALRNLRGHDRDGAETADALALPS